MVLECHNCDATRDNPVAKNYVSKLSVNVSDNVMLTIAYTAMMVKFKRIFTVALAIEGLSLDLNIGVYFTRVGMK